MMFARFARRIIEADGHQFADSPNMIRDPKRHSWRLANGFVNMAKIIMRDVQTNGSDVMVKFLTETVCQSRKPALLHT
jgi:very-short-patch-repair endonuclease